MLLDLVDADQRHQLHPLCQQKDIVEYCQKNNIVVQAYCPIIRGQMDNEIIQSVAKKVREPVNFILLACNAGMADTIQPPSTPGTPPKS